MNIMNATKTNLELEKEKATRLYEDSKQTSAAPFDKEKEAAERIYSKGKEQAEQMYNTVKDSASDLYEQGIKHTQEYSEELVNLVKNKPLIALAIAGGLGFILSAVFKKQK